MSGNSPALSMRGRVPAADTNETQFAIDQRVSPLAIPAVEPPLLELTSSAVDPKRIDRFLSDVAVVHALEETAETAQR